jgi:hypothetical protein
LLPSCCSLCCRLLQAPEDCQVRRVQRHAV